MSYSVRIPNDAELQTTILSLWEKSLPNYVRERFSWIYENNPSGRPITLLLRHESTGNIVGCVALFPHYISMNGSTMRSFICGDLVVDKAHRAYGPAMLLLKAAISKCNEHGPCVLVSYPNSKSMPLTIRAGFTVAGDFAEWKYFNKTRRILRKFIKSSVLAHYLALPLDCLLRLRLIPLIASNKKRYEFEIVSVFDQEFDSLWSLCKTEFGCIGERSSDHLNWRICKSPYGEYEIFALRSLSVGNIVGYIAFSTHNKNVQIIDLAFTGGLQTLDSLLVMFLDHQHALGVDSIGICLAANKFICDRLKGLGFLRRDHQDMVIIYSSEGIDDLNALQQTNWYFTEADNDI